MVLFVAFSYSGVYFPRTSQKPYPLNFVCFYAIAVAKSFHFSRFDFYAAVMSALNKQAPTIEQLDSISCGFLSMYDIYRVTRKTAELWLVLSHLNEKVAMNTK